MREKEIKSILSSTVVLDGILSKGYGSIPKYVMQHESLSIEAKAIYSYLASFTGGGDSHTCYPSIKKMCHDLGISEARLLKHRKQLIVNGLITITRSRKKVEYTDNTRKEYRDNNVYTLVTSFEMMNNLKLQYVESKDISHVEHVVKPSKTVNLENRGVGTNHVETVENRDVALHQCFVGVENLCKQNNVRNNNNNNNNIKNNNINTTTSSKKSSSSDIKITLDLKGITKTNIKRLKLTQSEIDVIESYILTKDYSDLDSYAYSVFKGVKMGNISLDTLKPVRIEAKASKTSHKNKYVPVNLRSSESDYEEYEFYENLDEEIPF